MEPGRTELVMLVLLFPPQSFHPKGEIPEDWQRSLSYPFHGHGRCQTWSFMRLSRTSTTPTAMPRAGGNLATVFLLQGKAPIHSVPALTARLGAEQFFEDNTEKIKMTALQHGEHSTWHDGSEKS